MFLGYGVFAGSGRYRNTDASNKIFQMDLTAHMIEDEIRDIRVENARLEAKLDELENK